MWFDLAKNYLKEAQNVIDKALDINDDDLTTSVTTITTEKAKTVPASPDGPNLDSINKWESFDGSFFKEDKTSKDNPPITNPPPSNKNSSVESVDLLSLPSSSSSQSTLTNFGSDSVEVVDYSVSKSVSNVNTDYELSSPDCKSPDSVEIITDEDEIKKDDSPPITVAPGRIHQLSTSKSSNDPDTELLSNSGNTLTLSESDSFYEVKSAKDDHDHILTGETKNPIYTGSFMDKSMESFEVQTQISDSSHSFEEVSASKMIQSMSSLPEATGDQKDKKNSNSGQTSGDELETATSSDIEIISSPRGDSSSTHSHKISPSKLISPQKNDQLLDLKSLDNSKKGHSRELSEISIISSMSDDSHSSNQTEVEKLLKRISELSETLEQREYKMMELGRNNAELHETNSQISSELDSYRKRKNSLDVSNVQEEYTQRLSALEKKHQQTIRDSSLLKKQTETLKQELASKISKEDHEKMVSEKNFVIDALKSEGEKLSKQILQHSNIIKKLRAKIRENEELIKSQSEQINELSEENKVLKKTLTTKDEIEKSQNDGINKLSSEKRRFDKENQVLKSQFDDLNQKYLALVTSHDGLKKELGDKSVEMTRNMESEKEKADSEHKQVLKEVADLRQKIRDSELAATTREQKLHQENLELKQKLEETEFRVEDQKQAASLASIPLIRQLESLQATLTKRSAVWENQEKNMLDKLEEAENKLQNQNDLEKTGKNQIIQLNLKVSNLEEKLSSSSLKLEKVTSQLQKQQIESELKENDYKKNIGKLTTEMEVQANSLDRFKGMLSDMEEKLRLEREKAEEEKRRFSFVQQQHHNEHLHGVQAQNETRILDNSSPTLSRVSDESLHSNHWNMEDIDASVNSVYGSQYGGVALQEGLQSILKQRDGEIQQLQWEMGRLQTERNFLSNELSSLTADLEQASESISRNKDIEEHFIELQTQHNQLLVIYGEEVEKYREIKLDLVEVKEMYKVQLEDLVKQINNAKPV